MDKELQTQAKKLNKNHQRRRRWYKILSVPVCLVVFITTYALILPAITLETAPDASCGFEQHVHTDSCYQIPGVPEHTQYVCEAASKAHSHTDACYDSSGTLICGKDEVVYRHTHDAFCFDSNGQLICTLPETVAPAAAVPSDEAADAAVSTDDEALESSAPEGSAPGTDDTPADAEDVAPAAEDAISAAEDSASPDEIPAHQHTAQCLETVPAVEPQGLICTLPEHTHTDACFAQPDEEEPAQEDTLPTEDADLISAADKSLMELTGAELAAIDDAELERRNDEFMALSDSELDELNRRVADFMLGGGTANDAESIDLYGVALQAVSVSNRVTVSVSDQVANTGCYVASAADPNGELSGHTVSFNWARSIDGGTYTTVAKQFYKVNGRVISNLSGDGNSQLNLALDHGGITDDETNITYRATLCADGEETNRTGTASNTTYNRSVLNGSFESPVVSRGVYAQYNYTRYASSLKWQTTADNQLIEIVQLTSGSSADSKSTWMSLYGNENYRTTYVYAASGNQYAEINAQADSALYQDVVTIPGVTMNWKLSHAMRPSTGRTVDTMYLCIMPESTARYYSTTESLRKLAMEKIGNSDSSMDSTTGIYVQKIQDNANWGTYTGTYTVPDGQYLTRFFFISGNPESHDLGNFLDDVWFGQELPPISPTDTPAITITKTINSALTEAERQQLLYQLTFNVIDNDTGEILASYPASELSTQWTKSGSGYTISKKISANALIGKTIRVEEANAEMTGYTLTADSPSDTVTINSGTTAAFDFTNTYAKSDDCHLQVQKIASGPDTSGTYDIQVSYETSNGETFFQTYSLKHGHYTGWIDVPDNAVVTITEPEHNGYHVSIKNGNTLLADSNTYTFTITGNTEITVYNTASVALPNTGGVPPEIFIFGGLTLIVIAIIGGCVARRRYGKEEE